MSTQIVAITVCGLIAWGILKFRPLLPLLFSSSLQSELPFSPNRLDVVDVVFFITILIGKAAWRSATKLAKFPSQTKGAASGADSTTSSLSVTMPLHVTPRDLDLFRIATQQIPTYDNEQTLTSIEAMLFLSTISEPATMLTLIKRASPIQPLGGVNVRNYFELLRPDLCCDPASLFALKDLYITARLATTGRPVKRGFEYDIHVAISTRDTNTTITRTDIFRKVFTLLEFVKHSLPVVDKTMNEPEKVRASFPQSSSITRPNSTNFTMPYRAPSHWAALCKDYNPIHFSAFAAKLFGFPTKIAHGNHIVAVAIAKLLASANGKIKSTLVSNDPACMEVVFKRPTTLPAELLVNVLAESIAERQSRTRLTVSMKDKERVEIIFGLLGSF